MQSIDNDRLAVRHDERRARLMAWRQAGNPDAGHYFIVPRVAKNFNPANH
jgi:hypothetical protein